MLNPSEIGKIINDIKENNVKLILCYGNQKELDAPVGVYEYSAITGLGEQDNDNTYVMFTKTDNSFESIFIPIENWMKINEENMVNSLNAFFLGIRDGSDISDIYPILDNVDDYLDQIDALVLENPLVVPRAYINYALDDINAIYNKKIGTPGSNYSIIPISCKKNDFSIQYKKNKKNHNKTHQTNKN